MTFNGGSSDVVSFDLRIGACDTQYGAAVFGFGGSTNNFVKARSNGYGSFGRYRFYVGNDGGGLFDTLSGAALRRLPQFGVAVNA